MKITLIFCLCWLCQLQGTAACGNMVPPDITQFNMFVNACSRQLACLIDMVCSMQTQVVKRDTSSALMNKLLPNAWKADFLQAKAERGQVMSRRTKRQVVNECCKASCRLSQLLDYCPDPDYS